MLMVMAFSFLTFTIIFDNSLLLKKSNLRKRYALTRKGEGALQVWGGEGVNADFLRGGRGGGMPV